MELPGHPPRLDRLGAVLLGIAIVVFHTMLIAAVWVVITDQVETERTQTIRSAIDRNDNIAIALEQYTVRTLSNADALIQYLIREYRNRGWEGGLAEIVSNNTIDNRTIVGLVLADETGAAITAALGQGRLARFNVSDREHFTVHVDGDTGKPFVGKPIPGRLTGKPVVPVTRRFNKPDGTFGGVAMALIEPARFTDVLQDAKLGRLATLSLVGLDGITRARLREGVTSWGENVSESPIFDQRNRQPVGNRYVLGQIDKVPRYLSYRTLPEYGLMVVVSAAASDVLAEFDARQTQYFRAAAIASAFIAAFAVFLLVMFANQRRSAAKVARSEASLAAAQRIAHVGSWERNVSDINENLVIMSDETFRVYGYEPGETEATREVFLRAVHPDDRERVAQAVAVALADGSDYELEHRIVRPDGAERIVRQLAAVERDESGRPVTFVGTVQDVTEQKHAESRLIEASRRLEALSDRLIELLENERATLARELHDEFGQTLTAVQLQLHSLAKGEASPAVEDCIALIDQTLQQVRSLSLNLRPPQLDSLGLVAALASHLDRAAEQSGVSVKFQRPAVEPRVFGSRATACFRIVQEAVTNALRHSEAQHIVVTLACDDKFLDVTIRDDGRGFEVQAMRAHAVGGASLGLLSMEERARMFGGAIEIRSSLGGGTEVSVRFIIHPEVAIAP